MVEIEKDLTRQEIDILIEAVDDWVGSGFSGLMMSGLLGSMMLSKDASEQDRARMKETRDAEKADYDQKVKTRKEQGIMLKAKLLKIRDAQLASTI